VLIIMPAVSTFMGAYGDLYIKIKEVLNIRKIESKDEVEGKLNALDETVKKIQTVIRQWKMEREKKLIAYIRLTSDLTPENLTEATKLFPGFVKIHYIFDEIRKDITSKVIIPLRNHLKNRKGCFDLEETLGDTLEKSVLKDLLRKYEDILVNVYQDSASTSNGIKEKVRKSNSSEVKRLEAKEECLRNFYFKVRKSIVSRAEFVLQAKAREFRESFYTLFKKDYEELKQTGVALVGIQGIETMLPEPQFDDEWWEERLKIPRDIFQADFTYTSTLSNREVVKTYQEGSCFPDTKRIYDDIDYFEINLPDAYGLSNAWEKGLMEEEKSVWEVLHVWLDDLFTDVLQRLEDALEGTRRIFYEELTRQKIRLEDRLMVEMELIKNTEEIFNRVSLKLAALKESVLEKN